MMKSSVRAFREYGFVVGVRVLLVAIHIQLIRLVAGFRPVILDVKFKGTVTLSEENYRTLIAYCKFNP